MQAVSRHRCFRLLSRSSTSKNATSFRVSMQKGKEGSTIILKLKQSILFWTRRSASIGPKIHRLFGTWQVKELLQAQFGDFDEISELRASKSKRATSSTSSRPSPRAVLAGARELETTAGQIGPFRSYPGSEEPSETEDLFGSEFDVESDTGTPKAMPAVAAPLVDMSPARSISDPKPVDVKEVSEEDSECEIVDVKEASEEEKRAREMVLSALGQMARTSIC